MDTCVIDKQPQMNSANYNPSVPPPPEQTHHRGKSCCFCLLRILWGLLVFIIIFLCLLILVPYILIQPQSFKFHVIKAKLTQFNYTDNNTNTLHYNLVLNLTATNPNKKLKIYYDVMEGNAFYKGYRFSATNVSMPWRSYLQNTKSKDNMSAVFSGQHVILLDRDEESDFQHDKNDGVFHIYVKFYFTIRFRLGDFIPGDTKGNIKCELEVPLGSNVNGFEPTKCEVNF